MSTKNLENLFRWHTKVEIKDRDDKLVDTVYIKLVGDVDYNQAQQFGLLASRKLRRRLRDKDSVEYQSLFLDLDERDKNDLILGVLLAEIMNFRDLAVAELGEDAFNKPPELPEGSTLEDREKQQETEEDIVKDRTQQLKDKMEEKSDERRAELEKMSIKDVRTIFVDSTINYRCLDEFGTAFREYCIFAGTYSDPKFKNKVFTDFDEFRNSSTYLKRQLIDAYTQLELTGEQLKN